jgi:hypothetical protein
MARIEQERINQAVDVLDKYHNPGSKLGRPIFSVAPYWHAYWVEREGPEFWSWRHNRIGLEKMMRDTPGLIRRNLPKKPQFLVDGFKGILNQFGKDAAA